jgi:class 3 adenylate cyclase
METELHLPEFHADDIHLIDQYRRQKNTAVLTVVFTDIKGFTDITEKYGEDFSNQFRRAHDALLYPIIERDGAGRVIKNIGDAVMAVFSEPSTAVLRCLEMQDAIRKSNKSRPKDQPDLSVRIGLHTGQVTTEDKVSLDVFGRHVNRAARVQGLADGGQVLMTYPVYDSAKGWLTGKAPGIQPVAWQEHGRYKLKGIPEEIQIFEAYHPTELKPVQPSGAIPVAVAPIARPKEAPRHTSGKLILTIISGALIVGTLVIAALMIFTPPPPPPLPPTPDVSLIDFSSDDDTQIDGQSVVIGGQKQDHIRPLISPQLSPGKHLLVMDINSGVRNFGILDVKPGKNILKVDLNSVNLPGISRIFNLSDNKPMDETEEQDFNTYPPNSPWPKPNHAKLELKVHSELPEAKKPNQVKFVIDWSITENGVENHGTCEVLNPDTTDSDHPVDQDLVLLKLPDHYYRGLFHSGGAGIQVSIDGTFLEYLKK